MATSSSSSSINACTLVVLALALNFSLATATARLGASSTYSIAAASSDGGSDATSTTSGAATRIVAAAKSALSATYAQISPEDRVFPDVVDARTGAWHFDDINANGAAGLLAGCLWSMHQLTGSEVWRVRALTTSATIRAAVAEAPPSQELGTLAYPALRNAYESETDPIEKAAYLAASLTAAESLAKLYTRIPGVLKVRPTADIAKEARAARAAAVSPLAVFSSPEGAAAATGLLLWAAALPGGNPAWRDMAVSNARRIAADHVRDDGSVRGTLVYKATSARAIPVELAAPSTTRVSPSSAGLVSSALAADAASPAAAGLDAWLGTLAGQAPSPALRQALTSLALAEAAVAAASPADREALAAAAQAAAAPLLDAAAADAAALEPVAAAASAAALAELAPLASSVPLRDAYAAAAQRIVVDVAAERLGRRHSSGAAEGAGAMAEAAVRWVSSLLLRGSGGGGAAAHTTAVPASILSRSGSRSGGDAALDGTGQGGSMLADHLLLQALVKMTPAS